MMEIHNYYLGTHLPRCEYMRLLLSRFPEEIIKNYNLRAMEVDGWVYIDTRKGMHGLKYSGLLTNKLLQKRLAPFGYYPSQHTPRLLLRKTKPISFPLIVDNFTVKYVGKDNAEHLRNTLIHSYELTTDWGGTSYSGITLKWDFQKRKCDISIPGYVANVLSKFQHDNSKHPQHTPSRYVTPAYGTYTQYATRDKTPTLTSKQCINIQKVICSVLYYARAVDTIVLMHLNEITMEQTKATEKTQAATDQILDYLATHPATTIRYHASDMILHSHYLSVYNDCIRLGGLFLLGYKPPNEDNLSGSILSVAAIIKMWWRQHHNQK
jgi:hypothetical protein